MDENKDRGQENEFSLESILAEFGSKSQGETPDPPTLPYTPKDEEEDAREKQEEAFFFPPKAKPSPEPPPEDTPPKDNITPMPPPPPPIKREPAPPPLEIPEEDSPEEPEEPTNVLEFPTPPPDNPVAAGIDKLRRKADDFAGHMFEEEGAETAQAVRRAERLIPGVDREEAPPPPPSRERKPRKVLPPPPDTPPAELFKRYSKGLKSLRLRTWLVFFLLLPLGYLTFAPALPAFLSDLPLTVSPKALRCWLLAGGQGLALLLGVDIFLRALTGPFRHRAGMESLTAFANLAVLIDALLLPTTDQLGVRLPFSAVAVLGLWCVMWGSLQKRRGQRYAARTAAMASEPYLVTRDEGKWNNRDTYAKWSGEGQGFGSQLQTADGAQRIYRVVVPLLLLASVLFSLISSLGHGRPQDFLWCLAAILSSTASLSATLCFGLPWRRLSAKLTKSGAALAGWQGVVNTTGSSNLLLTDIDLFPHGSVTLNGIKVFGSFPIEKVIGVTATVLRDAGCGLDKTFHDLLRSQGAIYRHGELFTAYEGGGVSEVFGQDLVQVGSASFMVLMDVALPPGLKVKNAVFCAINGELAGIFALNYHLPGTVLPALDILIQNKITPVLCTRDFNLIPSMLRQRFKVPVEKMEFPPVERRRELSDPKQDHSPILTAVLCREGVGPYAEAVVGARRLRTAVRLSAVLACLGSVAGALLSFYLTFVAAYASLTPFNLTVFLLMWLVPTPLIAGWVDRY